MGSFFNQTIFCPNCGGSGYIDIDNTKTRSKCQECQGNGVFVRTSDYLNYFGSSSYFDFLKREKIRTLRVVYSVIGFVLLAGFILGFIYLMSMGTAMVGGNIVKP
jgi:hypothetical protein